jgi:hypothetical protein
LLRPVAINRSYSCPPERTPPPLPLPPPIAHYTARAHVVCRRTRDMGDIVQAGGKSQCSLSVKQYTKWNPHLPFPILRKESKKQPCASDMYFPGSILNAHMEKLILILQYGKEKAIPIQYRYATIWISWWVNKTLQKLLPPPTPSPFHQLSLPRSLVKITLPLA